MPPDHLNLVRFRNDGDEFHVLWTARHTLKMLDPGSRLVAVAIEGMSGNELADRTRLEAGLLVMPPVYVQRPFNERIIVPPQRDAVRVEDPCVVEAAGARPPSDPLADAAMRG
jgi:hypothetical protein